MTVKKLKFDLLTQSPGSGGGGGGGGREGGGVCGQTISYHVAVFFTLFHMICNMTRF